jgi:hypothetical protein
VHEAGLAAPQEAGGRAEGTVVACIAPGEVHAEGQGLGQGREGAFAGPCG